MPEISQHIEKQENSLIISPYESIEQNVPLPLFFPRKILKVEQIKSGKWNPQAWFISERTNKRAIKLEEPTEISHLALASGYRSCIIRKEDKYLKLKGVSKKANRNYQVIGEKETVKIGGKGMAYFKECLSEHINTLALHNKNFPFMQYFPLFIEPYIHFEETNPNVIFKNYMEMPPPFKVDMQENFKSAVKRCMEYQKQNIQFYNDRKFRFVSGYRINSDTRLDETVYHLTKKEYRGINKIVRDMCLEYLFFKAGEIKATLTQIGLSMGKEHITTNNHPGNYVIGSINGIVEVGLCDLSELKGKSSFYGKNEFEKFTLEEMHVMKEDLVSNLTCSFASDIPYRYFSKQLKENCFNAFHTGYENLKINTAQIQGITYLPNMPRKVIYPLTEKIYEEEFRSIIQKIKAN
jgi:hypothetical protein